MIKNSGLKLTSHPVLIRVKVVFVQIPLVSTGLIEKSDVTWFIELLSIVPTTTVSISVHPPDSVTLITYVPAKRVSMSSVVSENQGYVVEDQEYVYGGRYPLLKRRSTAPSELPSQLASVIL